MNAKSVQHESFRVAIPAVLFLGLFVHTEVIAQAPPIPGLIHRFTFPVPFGDPSSQEYIAANVRRYQVLEMVNVGDRGSVDPTTTPPTTKDVKDGFDDFAILFCNRLQPPRTSIDPMWDPKIWVYDGRSGERLRDSNGVLIEYVFPYAEFFGVGWGGLNADGGKDLTGDGWPDLVVGAPGAQDMNANPVGALYILSMRNPSGGLIQRIDAPNPAHSADGVEEALVVAPQLEVFETSPATQRVERDVQHVVRLVVRLVPLEHADPPVDLRDQPGPTRELHHHADAPIRDGPRPRGHLERDPRCRQHRSIPRLVAKPRQPPRHSSLAP